MRCCSVSTVSQCCVRACACAPYPQAPVEDRLMSLVTAESFVDLLNHAKATGNEGLKSRCLQVAVAKLDDGKLGAVHAGLPGHAIREIDILLAAIERNPLGKVARW